MLDDREEMASIDAELHQMFAGAMGGIVATVVVLLFVLWSRSWTGQEIQALQPMVIETAGDTGNPEVWL